MKKALLLPIMVGTLYLACATPSGGRGAGISGAAPGDAPLTSVAGMTAAIKEIEQALGTERIKPIRERYQKEYLADPKDPFIRFLWAYSLDDREEAWQELTKITKLNDRFYWVYVGMGVILDGWKVDDQAEARFNRALELGPKIAIGYARFGRMFLRKRDPERALTYLRTAVELDPVGLEYQVDLARSLDLAGKTQDALAGYRRIIEADPSTFIGHRELGDLLKKAGDKGAAVESYSKAVALDAAAFDVRFDRALLLEELGRNDEALPAFQEACQVKPELISCWQAVARLAEKVGKREIVANAFEHVIQIEPGNLVAHKFLAPVYLESGEIEKALPSYKVIVRSEKDNLDALMGMATIFERGEEFSKAIEYTERTLRLRSDFPAARALQQRLFAQFHVLAEPISGKSPDQVFAKNRTQLASVYKERLKSMPKLKGGFLVKVKVTNDGSVEEAVVSKDTVGDQVLSLCAIWNLKRSRFPTGIGATYDFELSLMPGD